MGGPDELLVHTPAVLSQRVHRAWVVMRLPAWPPSVGGHRRSRHRLRASGLDQDWQDGFVNGGHDDRGGKEITTPSSRSDDQDPSMHDVT